jgi:hypothetical protein
LLLLASCNSSGQNGKQKLKVVVPWPAGIPRNNYSSTHTPVSFSLGLLLLVIMQLSFTGDYACSIRSAPFSTHIKKYFRHDQVCSLHGIVHFAITSIFFWTSDLQFQLLLTVPK